MFDNRFARLRIVRNMGQQLCYNRIEQEKICVAKENGNMGWGHTYKCKNCGKSGELFLGVGARYPTVCKRAKEAAVRGKLGRGLLHAALEYPDGNVDCEKILYACDCGGWTVTQRLDYFIAEDAVIQSRPYASWEQLGATPIYRYRHMCPKCRKKMHPYPEKDIRKLNCPVCGGKLVFHLGEIMWD